MSDRRIVVRRAFDGSVWVTGEPIVLFRAASGAPPPPPPPLDPAVEIRRLAFDSLGGPIVIPTRAEDGSIRSYVSWPKSGDRSLAEAIALAELPLDAEPIGDFATGETDDAALQASAAVATKTAARRSRRALIEQRRRDAEAGFAAIEKEIFERSRARRVSRRRARTP